MKASSYQRDAASFYLPPDLIEQISSIAEKTNCSFAEVVEDALGSILEKRHDEDAAYVSAPVNAMMKGFYEEDTQIGYLKRYGDFGLGTFNGLDGEMIMIDGRVFQLKSDGNAYEVEDDVLTPFACVTFFRPYSFENIVEEMSNVSFNKLLENIIPSKNMFYAIRVEGLFREMKVWSMRKQENHIPIMEPLYAQATFEYQDVEGTLLGFYAPVFMKFMIMPGFHFHFITADRKHGGHMYECRLASGELAMQHLARLKMDLPLTLDYLTADLRR